MNKILIFMLLLLLSVPVLADGFGANDKVLYFNSDVLIDVIKRNFPEDLHLNVANQYVGLMDSNGNMSVNDLVVVCKTGGLNYEKCRKFIQDLLDTSENTEIKSFYWADYVKYGFEGGLNIYNSGDGYFRNSKGLNDAEWAVSFPWNRSTSFKKQYPGIEHITGASACTNDTGTEYTADSGKNFTLNQQSGQHCWCKMTSPEQSSWIYKSDKTSGVGGKCERSCSLSCMTSLRDEERMRDAMFTAVKLNGVNANTEQDSSLVKNLEKEFKPCEFDWANDTDGNARWGGHKTRKPEFFHQQAFYDYHEGMADEARRSGYSNANESVKRHTEILKEYKNCSEDPEHYARNATGLNDEEWNVGGFEWMKNESFQCRYPKVTKIKGVATCNTVKGEYGKATNKSFKSNETTGFNCWCKMTYPEQSKWVFLGAFDIRSNPILKSKDIVVETYTENNEIVGRNVRLEKHQRSDKEKNLSLKADISYCDSVCVAYCGSEYEVELHEAMFNSIGKK